jgi:hypothetical protein
MLAQDFFARKAEVLARAIVVENDRSSPVDGNDDIRATLDELLKVLDG